MLIRRQGVAVVFERNKLMFSLFGHQDLRHGLQGLDAVFVILHELGQDLTVLRLIEESELEPLWLLRLLLLKPTNILLFLTGSIVLLRFHSYLVPRRLERIPIVLRLIVNCLRHFRSLCLLVTWDLR